MVAPKLSSRGEQTKNRQLEVMQRETAKTQRRVNDCPFLKGNLVTGLAFVASVAQTIDHQLGQSCQGFIVVRNYGATNGIVPVEAPTQPPDRTKQIALVTPLNGTFDIWFF